VTFVPEIEILIHFCVLFVWRIVLIDLCVCLFVCLFLWRIVQEFSVVSGFFKSISFMPKVDCFLLLSFSCGFVEGCIVVGFLSFFISFFLLVFLKVGCGFSFMFFQKVQGGSGFHPGPGDDVCRGVKGLFVEEELFITDSSENKTKEDRGEEHGRQ